jgi:hypothetical protein
MRPILPPAAQVWPVFTACLSEDRYETPSMKGASGETTTNQRKYHHQPWSEPPPPRPLIEQYSPFEL